MTATEFLSAINITLLLAVGALLLALLQLGQAYRQTKGLEIYEGKLDFIRDAMSTRYLGQFPEYNKEIAALIERAGHSVVMFYDLPGYGLFSDYHSWFLLHQAIQRKVESEVQLSVSVYEKSRRMAILREQFYHQGEQLAHWIETPLIRPKMEKFLKTYGGSHGVESLTHEKFHELIESAHQRVIDETFRGIKIDEVREHLPVYFWLVDEQEAIFAIPTFTRTSTEHGFYTSDHSLISALQEMRQRYLRAEEGTYP